MATHVSGTIILHEVSVTIIIHVLAHDVNTNEFLALS